MREEGYRVDLPDSHADLRDAILNGNAKQLGPEANVYKRIPVDDHVLSERRVATRVQTTRYRRHSPELQISARSRDCPKLRAGRAEASCLNATSPT